NNLLHGGYEDLSISNAASLGRSHNRFNDHVLQVVRDDYFYLGFGEKVNDIFGTTIEFGMAALSAKAAHLTDGHTLDARGVELFLHFVQLKGFNDRLTLFHDLFSSGVSLYCPTLPQDSSTDRRQQHYPHAHQSSWVTRSMLQALHNWRWCASAGLLHFLRRSGCSKGAF